MKLSSLRAFSLLEALAVVAILGILLFVTLPHLSNSKLIGERSAAKTKATALNIAKDAFIAALGVEEAQNDWNTNTNDTSRYLLVRSYLTPVPTAADLASYSVPGFLMFFTPPGSSATPLVTEQVLLYEDKDLSGTYSAGDEYISY